MQCLLEAKRGDCSSAVRHLRSLIPGEPPHSNECAGVLGDWTYRLADSDGSSHGGALRGGLCTHSPEYRLALPSAGAGLNCDWREFEGNISATYI